MEKIEIEQQKSTLINSYLFAFFIKTNRELDYAIIAVEKEQLSKLCIIDMIVSDPMDAPDYLIRLRRSCAAAL
ncbi:hypothetical protein [Cohnella silvisoli]|uniref:Uncharacterized protein n=1 Tax=Cohnella silvisoli TaxID=2873699 RepID=A0ABV1L3C9_9BACL|nr:hypothetical protein [Cohnella silvisoli]MCD9026090.1 hypothetical protein [Cohnella silvisoli]